VDCPAGKKCNGCTMVNNAVTCLACADANYVVNPSTGDCECSGYMDSTTCKACHASCYRCTAAGDTACSDCYSGMTKNGTKCECPAGTYFDSSTKTCKACHSLCSTCTSATSCSGCVSSNFKVPTGGGICECDLTKS
jgi:hypothetical protein